MFNFTLREHGSDLFVTYTKIQPSGPSVKQTISLADFEKLLNKIKTPESTEVSKTILEDTGIIPDTLIRRVKYSSETVYTFYYQNILTKFRFSIYSDHMNKTVEDLIQNHLSEYLEVVPYNSNDLLVRFKKHIRVPEVYYRASVKVGRSLEENVLFGLPKIQGMFKEAMTENTKVAKSFLPNHFDSAICWGRTDTDVNAHLEAAREGDLKALNSHAYLYLNSVFNYDLMPDQQWSSYTEEGVKDKVIDFYTKIFQTEREHIETLFSFNFRWYSILLQIALACDLDLRLEYENSLRTHTLKTLTV